ncbi:hypothetical protein BJY04DRAFT_219843 [Aspergillus karnatakaensis]|uniref:uncharacterized protein n=1 Tax=Aspergillus karnatakaensis TaxID=1810916 RepID=UPI003CCCD8BC
MDLQSLPDEVLLLMISYIEDHKDALSLTLQSRRLHALCELPLRRRYRRVRITSNKHIDNAFNLLLTILRKPRLGIWVRHIRVQRQPGVHGRYQPGPWQRALGANDLSLLQSATRNAGFTGQAEVTVMNMLMEDTTKKPTSNGTRRSIFATVSRPVFTGQAVAALLLTVCPNITSLTVGAHPTANLPMSRHLPGTRGEESHYPLIAFLRALSDPATSPKPPSLQRLRAVTVLRTPRLPQGHAVTGFLHWMDLFRNLPDLISLHADGISSAAIDSHIPQTSIIQELHISNSKLDTRSFTNALCAIATLRKLTYTTGNYISTFVAAPDRFNLLTLIRCLLRHRETLESLILDCDAQIGPTEDTNSRVPLYDERGGLPDNRSSNPPISTLWKESGSLRDFRALREMTCSLHVFLALARGVKEASAGCGVGDEISKEGGLGLPPALKYLCVRGYEKGVCGEVDEEVNGLRGVLGEYADLEVEGLDGVVAAGLDLGPGDVVGDDEGIEEEWTDYEY